MVTLTQPGGSRAVTPLLSLFLLLLLAAGGATAQNGGDGENGGEESVPNPAGLVLQREHPEAFVGGEEVMVTVTIAAPSDAALFALGLYETPPAGWTFEGMYVEAGPAPDILPPLGATGVLEFGWVSPAVPVRMRYALRVPPKDQGARFLTGQVEYRLESDPRRNTAPVLTQLDGVANEAPVVTLRGAARLEWPLGQVFVDPGATAQDKEDGDLSERVEIAGLVNTGEPGTYTLTYGVLDSTGNRAEPVLREVEVLADNDGDPTGPGGGGTDGNDRPAPGGAMNGAGVSAPIRLARRQEPQRNPISLIIPDIVLGESRPDHQLPPGDEPGGRESQSSGSDGAVAEREATGTTHGPDRQNQIPADGVGFSTLPVSEDEVPPGQWMSEEVPAPPVFIAVAFVLLLAGGVAGWRTLRTGSPSRRRR